MRLAAFMCASWDATSFDQRSMPVVIVAMRGGRETSTPGGPSCRRSHRGGCPYGRVLPALECKIALRGSEPKSLDQVWEEFRNADDMTNSNDRDQYANDSHHDAYRACSPVRHVSLSYDPWRREHFPPSHNLDVRTTVVIDFPAVE